MTVGDRIRNRRQELGMSQEELAHKIGYASRAAINKIELGERTLRQNKIAELAKALDVSPLYIIGWDNEPEEDINKLINSYPQQKKELCIEFFKLLSQCTEDELKEEIKHLEFILYRRS